MLRHLSRLMETTGFDLINFPEYGAEGFAFLLNRTVWNRVPVVIQLHGPLSMFVARVGWPPAGSEQARVGIFMEETSIRLADALMASSANIADFTAEAHGVPREAIDVVHCGVDTDVFRPDEQPGREGARPTVLFAGNMAPNKGVNTVFEAGLRLRAKYPDLRLQFLGKGDPELIERLRSRARAAGAVANLELLGYVADRDRLPALYRGADVFCSPARHEVGVANVYVEAMACGCPVVASTTGGAPEGVEHGRSGLLVPPNDVDATAAREIATEYFDAGWVLDRLVQEAMRSGGRSTAP